MTGPDDAGRARMPAIPGWMLRGTEPDPGAEPVAGETATWPPAEPGTEQHAEQVRTAIGSRWPAEVDTLPVAECFGPTLQGEGPHAGRRAVFLRLMGCNLSCAWCDTAFTWDSRYFDLREGTMHATAGRLWDDYITAVAEPGSGTLLVITGGEPLLQQQRLAWQRLLELAQPDRWRHPAFPVHVETNGTIAPTDHTLDHTSAIVVSPKLSNAGGHRGHQDPALHDAWLETVHRHPGVVFKVVVASTEDAYSAAEWLLGEGVPPERVWLMPEGITSGAVAARWREVAEAAVASGVNATTRLHVLAWGNERGR